MDDARDHTITALRCAGFAFAVVNAENMLKITEFPVRLTIVAERRPTRRNRLGQDLADDRDKCADFFG